MGMRMGENAVEMDRAGDAIARNDIQTGAKWG